MLIRPIKKPTDREIRKYAHMIIEQAKYDTIILSQIFNNIAPGILYDAFFIANEYGGTTKKYQYKKRQDGVLKFNISRDQAKLSRINPYHRQEYIVYVANYYELSEKLPPISMEGITASSDDNCVMTKIIIQSHHSNSRVKHRKQFEIFGFLKILTKLDRNILLKIEGRMLAES